jgi:hypothetical protein
MGAGPKYRCKKCGDVIQSTYRHDFKWCSCGAFAIDGGSDYTKLTGNWDDFEEVKDEEEAKDTSPS